MKKDKEIIDEIVDRLKAKTDFTYKEGAWERFQDVDRHHSKQNVRQMIKYASVAALLLMGLLISYLVFHSKEELANQIESTEENLAYESNPLVDIYEEERKSTQSLAPQLEKGTIAVGSTSTVHERNAVELPYLVEATIKHSNIDLPANDRSITLEHLALHKNQVSLHTIIPAPERHAPLAQQMVLANAVTVNNVYSTNDLTKTMGAKKFKYNDRFDLGIFVSPYSSSDNLKVGAGFTVAYNLTNKISVRSGASYNTYEVGVLKNPLAASSVEVVETKVVNSAIQYDNGSNMQSAKLALPNINAVTGFVQSIEIPLEMKYNLSRSFYATAGVSYSTIISQERNAQYVENLDLKTFSNGFPTNEREATQALQAVTKTVKSAEQNVNTNGYNGFVNFSVGKKVNLNRKFGISVEPYFKLPVGEFRRADMNYSNGGVRIMTNF